MPLELAQRRLKHLLCHAPDIFPTIASHLDSVTRGKRMSFSTAILQQRYQRLIDYRIQGWSGRRSFTAAVDVWPCPEGGVRAPFCLGILEYPMCSGPSGLLPMFGSVDGEAKIITQVVISFPEGIRLSSYCRSASVVFGL
jgi:hypothetical protein